MALKILHIDTEKGYRGGQRQLLLLTKGLLEKKIKTIIVCKPGSDLEQICKTNNYPFYVVKMRNELSILSAYKIAKICRKEEINIIHLQTSHAIAFGLWSKLFYKKAKLIISRRVDFHISKNFISQFKYKNRYISKIACVSHGISKVLESDGIQDSVLEVIHSAIDSDSYKNIKITKNIKEKYSIPKENIIIGTIAAFEDHKNYKNLIYAAQEVLNKHKNITFICCGNGKEFDTIFELTKKLKINNSFLFTGFIENIHDYLSIFDIFALPSKLEGLGSTLIDAQYYSLPIVACKTGGIPEIVNHKINGLLSLPEDHSEFAKNLLYLIENKDKRKSFGLAAKNNVSKFDIKILIDKYIELYNKILNKKNILIDLGALRHKFCGLYNISNNFAKYIANLNQNKFQFTFLVPKSHIGKYGTSVNYERLNIIRKNNLSIFCPSYDLWHSIQQTSYYSPLKKDLNILTIHDMNFLGEKKSDYKQIKYLDKLQNKVNKANYLTYISNFTKDTVEKNLKISNKIKTKVIYNGVKNNSHLDKQKPSFLPNGKFLFTIGEVKEKKNFHVLIEMLKYNSEYNLIISGNLSSESYISKIKGLILKNNLNDRIILSGPISEMEKGYLYDNCEAFVFPSKFEGFGLPIIEAMFYHKPIICSTCTSLPEIGGNNAYYWDSFEPEYMNKILINSINDFKNNKEIKIKNINEYVTKFTWEQNIKEYLKIYSELLNNE